MALAVTCTFAKPLKSGALFMALLLPRITDLPLEMTILPSLPLQIALPAAFSIVPPAISRTVSAAVPPTRKIAPSLDLLVLPIIFAVPLMVILPAILFAIAMPLPVFFTSPPETFTLPVAPLCIAMYTASTVPPLTLALPLPLFFIAVPINSRAFSTVPPLTTRLPPFKAIVALLELVTLPPPPLTVSVIFSIPPSLRVIAEALLAPLRSVLPFSSRVKETSRIVIFSAVSFSRVMV